LAKVVAIESRAPGVFEIELERGTLVYSPGDCTLLIRDDQVDSRPYSFSSHPDESVLRFLVRRLDGNNRFSTWLSERRAGDEVGVGTPFGWFRPGRSEKEVWMATGTGISPFLAVLRGSQGLRPRGLWLGVRSEQDTILSSWLADRVPVHWSFSRSGGPRRYVGDALEEIPVESDLDYYLCGNQRMCRSLSEKLSNRGVAKKNIHEELFCP